MTIIISQHWIITRKYLAYNLKGEEMNIRNTMLNFLYDKDYFISLYENHIHIYNYEELIDINETHVIFKFTNFTLNIDGDSLFITKLLPNEVLIKGHIQNVGFNYE